jgi:heptosyltransferase II
MTSLKRKYILTRLYFNRNLFLIDTMNFLVIRLSSMGDVILATSVFSFLKSTSPESKIWFVTGSAYAELFTRDPRLERVVGVEKGRETDAAGELATVAWDRIIDLQNNRRSRAIRAGLSATEPAGIFKKLRWERFVLLALRRNIYSPENHVIARYAYAAGSKGPAFPPATLFIDRKTGDSVGRYVPDNSVVRPLIALFPFSHWKNKEWPVQYFEFVGRYFIVKGWHVIIFGGPQDVPFAEELRARIGDHCVSVAGTLSLYESACLINRCNLALGNDTGLSHLARACGVKTGIVYGATTWHFGFFPYKGLPNKVFEFPLSCRPCHAHGGNFCIRGSRKCLRMIKPETVISGLMELYHET